MDQGHLERRVRPRMAPVPWSFGGRCGSWAAGTRATPPTFPRICNNEVWSTRDGADWSLIRPNTFRDRSFDPVKDWEGRHTAGYVAYRDQMWIIGGDSNQGHYQGDVWNSADGQSWNLVNAGHRAVGAARASSDDGLQGPDLGDGRADAAAVRPHQEVVHDDLWNTGDGVRWSRTSSPRGRPGARGMIGRQRVPGPDVDPGRGDLRHTRRPARSFFNDVWSSPDGVRWTRHLDHAPWAPRQYHEVAVFDDRLWVLEGYAGRNLNDVWHSQDGHRWEPVPDTPWAPRHAASVFVLEGALWVAPAITWSRMSGSSSVGTRRITMGRAAQSYRSRSPSWIPGSPPDEDSVRLSVLCRGRLRGRRGRREDGAVQTLRAPLHHPFPRHRCGGARGLRALRRDGRGRVRGRQPGSGLGLRPGARRRPD